MFTLPLSTLGLPETVGYFAALIAFLAMVLQFIIAVEVHANAKKLLSDGNQLFLLSPFLWSAVTFVFGIAGLAFYWACHHSNLSVTTKRSV